MASRVHILAQLRRLQAVFKPPVDDVTTLVSVWDDVLGAAADSGVEQAVTAYLRGSHRYFPKPGEIRVTAMKLAPPDHRVLSPKASYVRWMNLGMREVLDGPNTPCPVCHGGLTEREGRTNLWHDHATHMAAGVGYAGPRGGDGKDGDTWQGN